MRFAEWDYLPGDHAPERIDWLAVEVGRYELDNGAIVEAGTFEANGGWRKIRFCGRFPGKPALLLSVQSDNDAVPVVARAMGVTAGRFRARFYREEGARRRPRPSATVGYLAVYLPDGVARIDGLPVQRSRVRLSDKKAEVLDETLWLHEEQSKDIETRHRKETVAVSIPTIVRTWCITSGAKAPIRRHHRRPSTWPPRSCPSTGSP